MKVETPQILWNSEGDKGINTALYSVSMLESGLAEDNAPLQQHNNNNARRKYGNVMVTSGNTSIINLWKVALQDHPDGSKSPMFTPASMAHKIDYLCSLTRHELAVNTCAFSPDGLHLATAGDQGCIIVWSVPPAFRGGGNGRHFWSTVSREQDLNVKIIPRSGQGICDISWSADSKRFLAGTIDHTVLVVEDRMYDNNNASGTAVAVDSDWKVVYQNSMDHTHYVQGVSYDPLGVYLASMGSDRSVRVFPRKTPPKSKKKVLRPTNGPGNAMLRTASCAPPPDHQRMVQQLLTDSKLELGKSKQVKFLPRKPTMDGRISPTTGRTIPQANRHHLYADEATLESFFRRLSWTADGSFLVTPAALYHHEDGDNSNSITGSNNNNNQKRSSFATYLFARHRFDEPFKVLTGLEKPSLAVRPNPCLFQLPKTTPVPLECKENQSPKGSPGVSASDDNRSTSPRSLPYRTVFAVLTQDSILVYDTHHNRPLTIVRGLHYANLVDCQWSADGHHLVVCSTDGYISIVSFGKGELGEIYTTPAETSQQVPAPATKTETDSSTADASQQPRVNVLTARPKAKDPPPTIPPCEPGQNVLEAPPSKKPKKTRIAPTLISTAGPPGPAQVKNGSTSKRPVDSVLEDAVPSVGEAVTKLTLSNDEKPAKKKKKIQPTLISAGN